MRVHPAPTKRNMAIGPLQQPLPAGATSVRRKHLRRLPHIFSKVLELPFAADADVYVEEDSDEFRFVAAADGGGGRFRAFSTVIHPGMVKVVVKLDGGGDLELEEEEGLELDRWRFRLPPSTRPGLATADYAEGELIVTVPKGEELPEEGGEILGGGNGDFSGTTMGRLVLVQ